MQHCLHCTRAVTCRPNVLNKTTPVYYIYSSTKWPSYINKIVSR